MSKEILVKMSRPALLKAGYTVVFGLTLVLLVLPKPYNEWFVLVLVPWLFYVINDSKAKKLSLEHDSIVIGKLRLKHKQIVKIAVHNEKIELLTNVNNKLMRLIVIVAKDKKRQDEINRMVQWWKVRPKGNAQETDNGQDNPPKMAIKK